MVPAGNKAGNKASFVGQPYHKNNSSSLSSSSSNRIDVKLVSNKKDYLKWTSKPSYMSHKLFDKDLVAIRKNKVTLTLNKPAYIGMCILKLSKVLMYKFHYDYIKNKYGNNSRLLFTDTDRLMYEVKTKDAYEYFSNDKELFHISNYSTKSKYYDNSNKWMIGKMKDETAGIAIEQFVEFKPGKDIFIFGRW